MPAIAWAISGSRQFTDSGDLDRHGPMKPNAIVLTGLKWRSLMVRRTRFAVPITARSPSRRAAACRRLGGTLSSAPPRRSEEPGVGDVGVPRGRYWRSPYPDKK